MSTLIPEVVGENGGRLIKHTGYYWLLLAEGIRLFAGILREIAALPSAAG